MATLHGVAISLSAAKSLSPLRRNAASGPDTECCGGCFYRAGSHRASRRTGFALKSGCLGVSRPEAIPSRGGEVHATLAGQVGSMFVSVAGEISSLRLRTPLVAQPAGLPILHRSSSASTGRPSPATDPATTSAHQRYKAYSPLLHRLARTNIVFVPNGSPGSAIAVHGAYTMAGCASSSGCSAPAAITCNG